MVVQVGVGDTFTYKKEHWVIVDVKDKVFVCKNKDTGAVAEFDKALVRKFVD